MASNPRGTPLSIGSVTFYDEEHPGELPLGLEQVQAEIKLIGGGKVIQTLGPQPKPITWKGTLFAVGNTTPFARIQQLNRMHADGKVQRLTYGPFAYDVVVADFDPIIYHQNLATYSITVNVYRDASGQYSSATSLSVDSQTQALLDQMQTKYNNLVNMDPTTSTWGPKITQLASELLALGPLALASGNQVQAILQTILNLLPTVNTYVASLTNVVPTGQQTQMLSLAVGIQSNLTNIQTNLGAGQTPLSVQVSGGDLHALAAQYYGDPTLWTTIARANGLWSPILPNGVFRTLVIPPAIPTTQIG